MWRTEIYNVCGFNCVILPIIFVLCHENTGWRLSTEVGGKEHQRGQKGALCSAGWVSPHPVTHLPYRCRWSLVFWSLRMTPAVMWQLAEKSKLKIPRAPLYLHFSSLLFLMNLAPWRGGHRGDLHVEGSKRIDDPGVVGSPCCGHRSLCFLPKANMRERKAKNSLWVCLLASISQPALKDKNYLLIHVRSAVS